MDKSVDTAIIVVYLGAMLGFGFWGKTRTRDSADFLVAGRRLGPVLYTGTMAAVVLGGASTVGGVGLGYRYGISGMWLVVAIAVGLLSLSLAFAGRIQRLRVFTVAQMLNLRYGTDFTSWSGFVMAAYTLMLAVTSTIAYATIFTVLFDIGRTASVILGGVIVMLYSAIGGMWSITLTDMVQFVLKTIGVFALLLPFTWHRAGGLDGIRARAAQSFFDPSAIGAQNIVTYFVVYSFGMLIGQDIWQRVCTARSPGVAKWGGTAAAIYCLCYGVAGALIGMAASTFLPHVTAQDDVYAIIAHTILPTGISGLVLAAAIAAMMSTASGALIATATVARADIAPLLGLGRSATTDPAETAGQDVEGDRRYVLALGALIIVIAALLDDVVRALTVSYAILVGGLLVPILGAFLWKRATGMGALCAMIAGTAVTLGTMCVFGLAANEPIYCGLAASAAAYVIGSLSTKPTPPDVLQTWSDRLTPPTSQSEPIVN